MVGVATRLVGEAGPWAVHVVSSLQPACPVPKEDDFEAKLLACYRRRVSP